MPSSQDIAKWVEIYLDAEQWQNIDDAIDDAISKALPKVSIEIRADFTEEHSNYVEEILRNKRAIQIEDGGIPSYDLDDNDRYIRRVNKRNADIAEKLRQIDPFKFEVVCKNILAKLGAASENTQKDYDGGVDFYALNLTYSADCPLPKSATIAVIGQAKRYAIDHCVTETEIRKFIGGAILKLDELRKQGKITVLSPVVYAFWTTSELHFHAKEFSRKMGIWHLDGMALAEYIIKFEMESEIFSSEDEAQ